ncbi:hypothetical protein G7046_g4847 [Stylonectria norvegica]|nr:hypothetical protein G7046_g4847 [Stylonectria norvegica]
MASAKVRGGGCVGCGGGGDGGSGGGGGGALAILGSVHALWIPEVGSPMDPLSHTRPRPPANSGRSPLEPLTIPAATRRDHCNHWSHEALAPGTPGTTPARPLKPLKPLKPWTGANIELEPTKPLIVIAPLRVAKLGTQTVPRTNEPTLCDQQRKLTQPSSSRGHTTRLFTEESIFILFLYGGQQQRLRWEGCNYIQSAVDLELVLLCGRISGQHRRGNA